MDNGSGVGVLDKAVTVLDAVAAGPASLAVLVQRTGLRRPTAYRLAVALEHHRLLDRDAQGRFVLGARLGEWAANPGDTLLSVAPTVLEQVRAATGESAQLYRREGNHRRCVAAVERAHGLRDTVPIGALLPLTAGSAAQVLLAWASPDDQRAGLSGDRFTAATLAAVRRRGWAASVAEREPGVASVSAPVRDPQGEVVAAVSVSGPIERLGRSPGRVHAPAVVTAAAALSRALAQPEGDATVTRLA